MALEAGLKERALRVADSLHRYAQSKNWEREDYRIFISINTDWNMMSVQFVAKAFNGMSEKGREERLRFYDDVKDHLEKDLRREPELYRSIGLHLTGRDEWDSSPGLRLGSSHVEIDDTLLNPGVPEWRGSFQSGTR